MRTKRGATWVFLCKKEDGQYVYVFEPLRKYEIHNRLQSGWEFVR